MVDFIKKCQKFGACVWQLFAVHHKDHTLDIFTKSMVSLEMSILLLGLPRLPKKNLKLCSIKIKGSHTPCKSTCSRSVYMYSHI